MICDFLAAGRAYQKDKFTYNNEYKWWCNYVKDLPHMKMHPIIHRFVSCILYYLTIYEDDKVLNIDFLKYIYDVEIRKYEYYVEKGELGYYYDKILKRDI